MPADRLPTEEASAVRLPTEGASAVRVWLEVDFEAEPIRGTLNAPGGAPYPFVGWLGLTAALKGLRAEPEATEMGEAR